MNREHLIRGELTGDVPESPKQTEYSCDVLVVGGGYAGLMAAVAAKTGDNEVILADKGKPHAAMRSQSEKLHQTQNPGMYRE